MLIEIDAFVSVECRSLIDGYQMASTEIKGKCASYVLTTFTQLLSLNC